MAGVDVLLAVRYIVAGDEHLPDHQTARVEESTVGINQAHLAHRRGCLESRHVRRTSRHAERLDPGRDRTTRDHHDTIAAGYHARNLVGEDLEVVVIDPAVFTRHGGAAELDHHRTLTHRPHRLRAPRTRMIPARCVRCRRPEHPQRATSTPHPYARGAAAGGRPPPRSSYRS